MLHTDAETELMLALPHQVGRGETRDWGGGAVPFHTDM
jgi:hypothetical protein